MKKPLDSWNAIAQGTNWQEDLTLIHWRTMGSWLVSARPQTYPGVGYQKPWNNGQAAIKGTLLHYNRPCMNWTARNNKSLFVSQFWRCAETTEIEIEPGNACQAKAGRGYRYHIWQQQPHLK